MEIVKNSKFYISIAVSLILAGVIYIIIPSPQQKVFKVAIRAIPSNIDPRNNEVNIYHYINAHLFYPLVEIEGGQVRSQFLDTSKTRALSLEFDTFHLCLKDNLKFSDGSKITSEDLKSTVSELHSTKLSLYPLKSIGAAGTNCIKVEIDGSDPGYFEKFTSINSTLLKKGTADIGFGPYRISKKSKSEITLIANKHQVKGPFKKIIFRKVTDLTDKTIFTRFDDWNYLWHHFDVDNYIPDDIKKSFLKVSRPLLKSLFIVADFGDKGLRSSFVSCFNRQKFINALGLDLNYTEGFLPTGLPGSNVNFTDITKKQDKSQSCKSTTFHSFKFINFHPNKKVMMESFFSNQLKNGVQNISLVNRSLQQTIDLLFNSTEKAVMLMADSPDNRTEGFFTFLMGSQKLIGKEIKGLRENVVLGARLHKFEEKQHYFTIAHEILLRSNYIIPLGQIKSVQYYRPGLKNIVLLDTILGFPKIHLLMGGSQ